MAYFILTQNATGDTERPEFTCTTTAVPEPKVLAFLAGVAGVAMIVRKRS